LTNTAIATIAAAIRRKDKAMIAVMMTSQNSGSCTFIVRRVNFDLCALDFAFVLPQKSVNRNQPPGKRKIKIEDQSTKYSFGYIAFSGL
jgi:hypothetical protein